MPSIFKFFGFKDRPTNHVATDLERAAIEMREARRELSQKLDASTKLATSITELIRSCDVAPAPKPRRRMTRNRLAH